MNDSLKIHNLSLTPSLISKYVEQLRNLKTQTDSMRFRKNFERIGAMMAYEISKSLSYEKAVVNTPLAEAQVDRYTDKIVVASILRAGLALHRGVLDVFDDAENCFVSAYRQYDSDTHFHVNVEYMAAPDLTDKTVVLCDPMLATGTSMELAIRALYTHGAPRRIIICTAFASQFAIDFAKKHFDPKVCELWTAVIDPSLNEHSYIVPGLGDAGDLAFGDKI